jgi:hypothetical protein
VFETQRRVFSEDQMFKRLITSIILCCAAEAAIAEEDAVLYCFRDHELTTSKYGPVATFQKALNEQLKSCSPPGPSVSADGAFGPGTQAAIIKFTKCHAFQHPLPPVSPAHQGAITSRLWSEILPAEAPPSPQQRANDLTLVFEATDYTALEFNYCQSRSPKTGKLWTDGDDECYSNDPCSFATWGPRGATVGGGHEIQTILWEVNETDAQEVSSAFGSEYDAAKRLLAADKESKEVLLCAAFVDPDRRKAWKNAFFKLGHSAKVRTIYDQVYLSKAADGEKMLQLYAVYKALRPLIGRDPTEIDYALFLDRATHGGAPKADEVDDLVSELSDYIKSTPEKVSPAQLRWKLIHNLPVSNQQRDRLGRDVVYVYDGLGNAVGSDAIKAWKERGPFKASDFGLSDERFVPTFVATPANGYGRAPNRDAATQSERDACPSVVLHPIHPSTGTVVVCSPR